MASDGSLSLVERDGAVLASTVLLVRDAPLSVSDLFDEQLKRQREKLPGARWMPQS